ncbi:delta-class carbonic anhydrase [Pseudotabrizicola sp. L79]|uniref:delta-class carbonic anhydrase n=1 Tax=Pseudotabrizicola sp. L79 TaxID=3118402 RepID=UPI002F95DF03
MIKTVCCFGTFIALAGTAAVAETHGHSVADSVILEQNAALAAATEGKGFGPQSPRDIDAKDGKNVRAFGEAPPANEMTLCDIHLHENAEHKGGEFTTYAGNGDGEGAGTGFKYNGELTEAELVPLDRKIGEGEHGDLVPGDTIEIHFVHSTAQATLGNGLGTCLNDSIGNPQLRVEAVVAVLVNDTSAADFTNIAKIENINGLNQVPNLPTDLGTPVLYDGSTTGPKYNETGSPFQVTWSVRPKVLKLDINSVGTWLESNPFDEEHAHGVRNLVVDPNLLSPIE